MDAPSSSSSVEKAAQVRRLVLKNTLFMTLAQVAGMPLSLLLSAVTARCLGASALGDLYLATTFNAFAFIPVDWGQTGALPAMVAENRSLSGALLGTSFLWRVPTSLLVSLVLLCGCYLLGYSHEVLVAIALASVGYTFSALTNSYQHVVFGFERTDIAARRQIIEQFVTLLLVLPVLALGGNLNQSLVAHVLATIVVFAYVWRSSRVVDIGRPVFDQAVLRRLLARGTPFVFLGLVMVLQPYVDALFLSKLGTAEAVGWHAAARKLVGFLLFPASALIGALYPTLCRLQATDREGFKTASSDVLRATTLVVLPVALGCALFPSIGVSVYSVGKFGPAEQNLRVLSLFLLLTYFTMPIGTCVMASGKSRAWTVVQGLCILVSVVLDPILVPRFQRSSGNGGLGVCWAAVVSEVVVLALGVYLAPRGIFGRRFWRTFALAGASGLAMVAVARVLERFNAFLVAPISVVAYLVMLRLTGAIDDEQMRSVRGFVGRKLARLTSRAG